MKAGMKLKEYCSELTGLEHDAISLEALFGPFALSLASKPDPTLIIGLVLEALCEDFAGEDVISPIEVAVTAADLGYGEAETFLTEAYKILELNAGAHRH